MTGAVGPALLEQRMVATFGVGHREYEHSNAGRVPLAYLNNAVRLVERSGVLPELAKWDAERRKSTAGNKPIIPQSAVLVLFLLNTQMGYGVTYHQMARTIDLRFGPKEFELLGIRNVGGDHDSWYHLLWAASKRMLSLIDPYPALRNHEMGSEELTEWHRQAALEDAAALSLQKLERINWLCKRLVTASVRMLPKDIWDRYKGNFAGDATKIRVAGKPNPADETSKRNNPDHYSGRYHREGSHEGTGAKTDDAAYELEKAVMVWNKPGENTLFPSMVVAVSFHRPGSVRGHAVYLTKTVQQEYGFGRITTIWDRNYNAGTIDSFAIPMRKLGVDLVIDYKVKDVGVQGHYKDLVMLDGNWHASWMPKKLIDATTDLESLGRQVSAAKDTLYGAKMRKKAATPEQVTKDNQARKVLAAAPAAEAELRNRIAARERYCMTPKGAPDADGFQRFTYPTAKTDLTGKASNNCGSITVPLLIPEGDSKSKKLKPQPIKSQQKYAHESPIWTPWYGMRSLVEASNNLVKLASAEDLGNPKKRSGRGYAFHYLASTLAVVSSNIRRIITFFEAEATRSETHIVRTRRRKNERGEALARNKELLTEPAAAP